MIAVDTNILVYAHRVDSAFHERAYPLLRELAEGPTPWAIPWPCLHEFFAIATHPRIYDPPTPTELALEQIDAWLECPRLFLLAEDDGYYGCLRPLLCAAQVAGPKVHDARIAGLCVRHGIDELWSADRDFGRFAALQVRNPLVTPPT